MATCHHVASLLARPAALLVTSSAPVSATIYHFTLSPHYLCEHDLKRVYYREKKDTSCDRNSMLEPSIEELFFLLNITA